MNWIKIIRTIFYTKKIENVFLLFIYINNKNPEIFPKWEKKFYFSENTSVKALVWCKVNLANRWVAENRYAQKKT